ncbi:diguanylate cyclase (GGDEF) domain-containing protein [Actinoplanes philippinensis]|uniref:Diguanylate cyclase (GGDEF) domain-containing protein n=1 Tax=Actinoplanes philippinensis TaxID=35752 RepID=A0A1I2LGH2_9ACTN|nr:GGDEF domain-containing protein [Actinoplanes philippinensis]SFF77648.1 diguanylate cyclase (GGDEF) domain-containing protein [Actinoplanes philippinensis]
MNGSLSTGSIPSAARPATVPRPDRSPAAVAAEIQSLEFRFGIDGAHVLARAAELAAEARGLGEHALTRWARLLEANMLRRNGDLAAAAGICSEVNAWAQQHRHRPLLARSHQQLSIVHDNLGDIAAGLEHAVRAVEALDDDASPRARGVILLRLADVLAQGGSIEAARTRYGHAEQVAVTAEDVDLHLVVLNNLAYAEHLSGDHERAWAAVQRLRAVTEAAGGQLSADALDTMAMIQVGRGRYAEAAEIARGNVEAYRIAGPDDADGLAEYLLTLAIAQRHLGETAAAQASLDRCTALCHERELAGVEVRVLQEQAELHAACGDTGRAFTVHKRFHQAERELHSQQRDAQARARHAVFETAEARREAERFREQARRDPLTGLPNRRYVDETLPGVLAGGPVVVALVDLDHFKRVNDVCSHEIGDRVLVALADLLLAAARPARFAARPAGFAARLGGEEFLLVLPGCGAGEAAPVLEEFRRAVQDHPWQPLTGDLPVTVSVGAAESGPRDTQRTVLGAADKLLYQAKHEGRNRCVISR